MTMPTNAGKTNSNAGMAMLRCGRKGSSTARTATRPPSVTTVPSTARWYVALVASTAWSHLRHDVPSFGVSSECTDALTGSGPVRWR